MRTTVTKRIEWDSAHRVMRHESKCATLHGHRYAAEIECEAEALDSVGRVVDFGVIKERVGAWVDDQWDHTTLLNSEDMDLSALLFAEHDADGRRAPFIFDDCNPTAEVIANTLLFQAQDLLADTGIRVTRVRVYETPTCWAEVVP